MSDPLRTIDVFIENPKGAIVKIHHDEEALIPTHCELVNAPYVFAYGFVVGVRASDGDMLDCFVISQTTLFTGERVDCVPFAYLEQWENEVEDFDLLTVPATEAHLIDSIDLDEVFEMLKGFLSEVFAGKQNREIRVGKLGTAQGAYDLIDRLSPT